MRAKSTCSSETQIKLRGASESDNRQVGMPGYMLDFHVKPGAGLAGDQRVRQRTWGTTRPDRPWLQPGTTIRGESVEVDLVWRLAPEGVVRSVLIIPVQRPGGAIAPPHRNQESRRSEDDHKGMGPVDLQRSFLSSGRYPPLFEGHLL